MSLYTPAYFIRTSGHSEPVLCEPLGLDPVSIRRANLDIDTLEMEQGKVRGAWAITLAHDAPVRLFRQDPDTLALRQIFVGRVVAPREAIDAHAKRRVIRVHNVMQLFKESTFQRGYWTPHFFRRSDQIYRHSSTFPFHQATPGRNFQGHECSPFYGFNFFAWPYSTGDLAGHNIASIVRQSVTRAVTEWAENVKFLARRNNSDIANSNPNAITNPNTGTSPALSMNAVWHPEVRRGDLGAAVWPEIQGPQEMNYLDWLILITQPLPDFCTWVDYSSPTFPQLHLRRFATQTAVTLPIGHPCMAVHTHRQQDQEASAVFVVNQYDGGGTSWRGRVVRAIYPLTTPRRNPLDRRSQIIDYGERLLITPSQGAVVAEQLGEILTAPIITGSLRLAGGAWQWCHPGSVLKLPTDGRLHVQETVHDLATETVTASVGPARHIGQYDAETIKAWLRGAFDFAGVPE